MYEYLHSGAKQGMNSTHTHTEISQLVHLIVQPTPTPTPLLPYWVPFISILGHSCALVCPTAVSCPYNQASQASQAARKLFQLSCPWCHNAARLARAARQPGNCIPPNKPQEWWIENLTLCSPTPCPSSSQSHKESTRVGTWEGVA